jgi:hypothetical protein
LHPFGLPPSIVQRSRRAPFRPVSCVFKWRHLRPQ